MKPFANVRMSHSRIIKTYDYSWDGAYIAMDDAIWNRLQTYARRTPIPSKSRIIAGTMLTLSCTMLFAIVCKRTRNPLQDHQNLWLWLRCCLHCHWRCNVKSFAKVRMTRPGTIKIYDCGWDGAYIVMDNAIWNRLQTYALPNPEPSQSTIIADTVLKLS